MRKSRAQKFPFVVLAAMVAAFAVFTASPQTACAETLDDKTIREIYATIANDAKDKFKSRQHMEERLADTYTLELTQNVAMSGMPPQRSTRKMSREETVASALRSYDSMSIESNKIEIFDIRYSQDKKIAYVRQTVTSSGTMMASGSATSALPASRYQNVGKCQEALTLVGDKIRFLQTACDTQISMGQ